MKKDDADVFYDQFMWVDAETGMLRALNPEDPDDAKIINEHLRQVDSGEAAVMDVDK